MTWWSNNLNGFKQIIDPFMTTHKTRHSLMIEYSVPSTKVSTSVFFLTANLMLFSIWISSNFWITTLLSLFTSRIYRAFEFSHSWRISAIQRIFTNLYVKSAVYFFATIKAGSFSLVSMVWKNVIRCKIFDR